jgi:ATP-dependent DNA helicase RecQ
MTIAAAQKILKDVFGYDNFRSGQEEVISALGKGENVLAVMPTGSGKSLCFQIPALMQDGLCIVISPLVALMEDQVAALKLAGVAAETINSSRSYEDNATNWRKIAGGETRILYISPERLMTVRMLDALSKLPVHLIAVDEAHCISRWGPAFRPEYEDLGKLKDIFPNASLTAMTATADEATRTDIATQLFGNNGKIFVSGFDRPNIRISVAMRRDWKQQLLSFVKSYEEDSGIVYCLSRKKTEEAAEFLASNGIHALPYHAGLDKSVRTLNQDTFMTEPNVVMVATIAFGMGIDKPDVRYVFHTNLPGSTEAYYQEIGRAGRDGKPAEAMMLYGFDDIRMRRMFIDQEGGEEDHRRREHKRLDTLISFCESPECRRQVLLTYFGETTEPCNNCDACLNPPDLIDGTQSAQHAMAAVMGTGNRFGAAHLIDVLRGANTERIRKFNHDQIPAYGTGKDISKPEWQSILRQLTAAGYLRLDVEGHGGLIMTDKGHDLASGHETFNYREDTGPVGPTKKAPRALAVDLSVRETSLFNALKALRLELAKKRNVPAYAVFPDRALADMAKRCPRDKTEFAEIHGVGASKLKKFSTPFLETIAAFQDEHA